MGRYGKWIAVAGCALAAIASAFSAESIYAVSNDLTGSCNASVYTSIYVSLSTGNAFTCNGTWTAFLFAADVPEVSADYVKYGVDIDLDGSLPQFVVDTTTAQNFAGFDLDKDGKLDLSLELSEGGSPETPYFYIGELYSPVRSYWWAEGFSGDGLVKILARDYIQLQTDTDDSGIKRIDLQTKRSGGNPYTTFRFDDITLTFEGAADDANEVNLTPQTLTGTQTLYLPDKTGGVVVLNGTTYPSPASPVCAEWQTDGRLGVAASNLACGSGGGSGDNVKVDTTTDPAPNLAPNDYINFIDSGRINVTGNAAGSPVDTVTWDLIANSVGATYITDDIVWGADDTFDFSSITYNAAGEGLVLPSATDCTSSTAPKQGALCWDTTSTNANTLWGSTGSGANWVQIASSGDVTDVFDCSGGNCAQITMSSSDFLRAGTAGQIALQQSTVNLADGTTTCTAAEIGDIRTDTVGSVVNPELFICSNTSPNPTWQYFAGVVGQTGVTTYETTSGTQGPGNTGQNGLDFQMGFDITPNTSPGDATEIAIDMTEITLNHIGTSTPGSFDTGIWVGGGLQGPTCQTEDKATVVYLPKCDGTNEALQWVPALDFTGCDNELEHEGYFTCTTITTASAISEMVDGPAADLDGVNAEIYVGSSPMSGGAVLMNPGGTGTGQKWVFDTDANNGAMMYPDISSIPYTASSIGTDTRPVGIMYSCLGFEFSGQPGCGSGKMSNDFDMDGTFDQKLELDSSGLKIYLTEGSTTPSMALVAGGIDANNDGVADNLSTNGLNKSMPNYNKSFTNETTVVMDDHYLSTDNLVTVCYDGSNNQIAPASVSIGTAPLYSVTATFSTGTTGRCVINGGANSRYVTSFSNQVSITITQASVGVDPYAARVICYDDADPRNMVEPDSIQIDDATLDMTINFAVGQTGRCTVS
jgi:hypothetical protein